MEGEYIHFDVFEMIEYTVAKYVDKIVSSKEDPSEWNLKELINMLNPIIPFKKIELTEDEKNLGDVSAFKERLQDEALQMYEVRCDEQFED